MSAVQEITFHPQQSRNAGYFTQPFLTNAWYVAMWAKDLPPATLVPRKIINEALVFLRKEDGSIVALADRCPHRFAPLSRGKVKDGDQIQCPYHGLVFDSGGACVHNPHGSQAIPPAAKVRSYPAVEKHRCVWVWMGTRTPDPSLIPDFSLLDTAPEAHMTKPDHITIGAHYQLVSDNLLDLSHAIYLHEGILGDSPTAEIKVEQQGDTVTVSRSAKSVPLVGIQRLYWPHPSTIVDRVNSIRWDAPCYLLLKATVCLPGQDPADGSGYWGVHLLTPETESTTAYHFTAVRFNVQTLESENEAINEKIGERRRFAFEQQDGPLIAAQQRTIDEATEVLNPVLLSIDVGPVRCKRILERMLKDD
ncbi:MAG: vanillate demethylase [Herminiimonas sp.]|nr:vanillate demethylase [Herminiimonas sp.]